MLGFDADIAKLVVIALFDREADEIPTALGAVLGDRRA